MPNTQDAIPGLCKGRNVYFYDGRPRRDGAPGLEPLTATVGRVQDAVTGQCLLSVLDDDTLAWGPMGAAYSETPQAGFWSWPPRT